MKEITEKSRFSKSINVPNLASKIQKISKTFDDFLFTVKKNVEYRDLSFEEFQKAFKSVKHNKASGHDDIDSNVIIKVCDEINYPLFMIFHSSFNEAIYPEQLKVANVSPIF